MSVLQNNLSQAVQAHKHKLQMDYASKPSDIAEDNRQRLADLEGEDTTTSMQDAYYMSTTPSVQYLQDPTTGQVYVQQVPQYATGGYYAAPSMGQYISYYG